jgi:hypothetical protein
MVRSAESLLYVLDLLELATSAEGQIGLLCYKWKFKESVDSHKAKREQSKAANGFQLIITFHKFVI